MTDIPFDAARLALNQHFKFPQYYDRHRRERMDQMLSQSALLRELSTALKQAAAARHV